MQARPQTVPGTAARSGCIRCGSRSRTVGVGDMSPRWSRPRRGGVASVASGMHLYFGEIQEMTRQTTKAAGPKDETAPSQFMALAGDNGATLGAMIKGMMTIVQAMIEFSNVRLRENLAASQRLMGCKDPNEAFGVQCELAR